MVGVKALNSKSTSGKRVTSSAFSNSIYAGSCFMLPINSSILQRSINEKTKINLKN